MTNISGLRAQLAQLRATMPTTSKPIAFVFASADGSLNQHNAEELRHARQAGAHVVRFRFMAPPSEEVTP